MILETAKSAGASPKTVAIVTDNTAASVSSVKPMRERLLKELGLQLVVDETFTPPLADATPLVQKVRAARPDLFFFLPTVISDAKLVLEKMNEFGMGKGRVPTIAFGIAMFEPDMLKTMSPELLDGMIGAVGSWGSKGHEAIIAELKSKYNEPWMTQNGVSTYADMLVIRDAIEKAGKADRAAVAEALRTMDGGPSKYYPGGRIRFGSDGRREGAGLTIIQWQSGVPMTIYTRTRGRKSQLAESSTCLRTVARWPPVTCGHRHHLRRCSPRSTKNKRPHLTRFQGNPCQ